ncbi:MAG: RadC family protein [Rubricella sp.]
MARERSARSGFDDGATLPGLLDRSVERVVAPAGDAGHRERLRQRFMEGGAAAVADYELLELVLFRAIPRQDLKPLARRLIASFGSLGGVLSADAEALARVQGAGPAVIREIRIVAAAAERLHRSRLAERDVISNWSALLDYCRTRVAYRSREAFIAIFLDRRNGVLRDELLAEGTVDHVPVYPREIARRAIEIGAAAVILVHNHPSGDPTPSRADIDMTARIHDALLALDITLHDHIVIGSAGHVSFRSEGLL